MIGVSDLHFQRLTVRNPATINRHLRPVTFLEAFISQRSRTTDTATRFLSARQLLHRPANRIIGGARRNHCWLVSIESCPFGFKISVRLGKTRTLATAPVSQEVRKPLNLLWLLRFKMTGSQHGHTLDTWFC